MGAKRQNGSASSCALLGDRSEMAPTGISDQPRFRPGLQRFAHDRAGVEPMIVE